MPMGAILSVSTKNDKTFIDNILEMGRPAGTP
jgi:hypothetical protein